MIGEIIDESILSLISLVPFFLLVFFFTAKMAKAIKNRSTFKSIIWAILVLFCGWICVNLCLDLLEKLQCKTTILYESGKRHLTNGNKKKAKNCLQFAAKKGHPDAQYLLGMIYTSEQNFSEATKYFINATTKNHPKATYMLGAMYRKGIGVEKDLSKAKIYLEQAAKQNIPEAMTSIGLMYFLGTGVKKDWNTAKEYFNNASKQNNLNAQLILSNIYICEKNFDQAEQLLKKMTSHCPINELKIIKDTQKYLDLFKKNKENFSDVYPQALALSDQCSKNIW